MSGRSVSKGQLDLLILGVLSRGSAHGYAIIDALRERSGGAFDLPEGSVYPALHKLEAAGLVVSSWTTVNGRRRRQYELSDDGRVILADRRDQWLRYSAGINALLGWTE